MSKEIALDLRRYDTPEKLSGLVYDTASLAIEASDIEDFPRVNPHFFVKRGENYVRVPGKDKRDILNMFAPDDPGTLAGKEIRKLLLEDKDDFAYVWISPSGPWPETRIEVGARKTKRNGEIEYLKSYGISTKLSPDKCLGIGQLLVSMSPNNYPFPASPDDLRNLTIKVSVPEGADPFEYLSKLIELPEKNRWNSILTKEADRNKAKIVKVAVSATEQIRNNPHFTYTNPAGYGAYIENRMKQEGFGMDPVRFGCGSSNIGVANSMSAFSYTETLSANLMGAENWHGGICRICGNSTWVGPCSICEPCESKL